MCAFEARRFAGFTPVIAFSEIYQLMFRRNFQKNWKILGTSHNSPEYLTISRERQRKFATRFVSPGEVRQLESGVRPSSGRPRVQRELGTPAILQIPYRRCALRFQNTDAPARHLRRTALAAE